MSKHETKYCKWILDNDPDDYYFNTSCGQAFFLSDGTLEDNEIKYCCFCGKPIKESVK